jgi:hypothetical protein
MGKTIDLRLPTAWTRHWFWTVGRRPLIAVVAVSPQCLAIGFEIVNGDARGLSVYFGPIWFALALAEKGNAQPQSGASNV